MVRTITAGVVLALAAAAALVVGDGFGWGLDAVLLLGVGAGAVLGLVPDGSPLAKAGGFALGLLAAAIGYALRAAVFPDTTTARAVAVVLVVLAATGLVLLTFGRSPLWSAFLGMAVLGGAYEEAYTESPGSLLSTLPVALTSVLTVVAVGFAATVFFAGADGQAGEPRRRRSSAQRPPDTEPDDEVSLDDVMRAGSN